MSLQPPPQPPSPGFGASGQGLGFGPPGGPQGGPTTTTGGGGGGRPGKTRHVSPVMIVSALVLIAVAVGVFVLTNGGDDALDAGGAADGLGALVDDADFGDDGSAVLRRCPFGDVEDLATDVADLLDLSDDVLDGNSTAVVEDDDGEGNPAFVVCQQQEELAVGDEGFGSWFSITAVDLPRGDWEDFLEDSAADGTDLDLADPQDHRGGVIHAYCSTSPVVESACGATWVQEDSDLVIGMAYTTDDDDPAAVVEALQQVLPGLLEELAEQA